MGPNRECLSPKHAEAYSRESKTQVKGSEVAFETYQIHHPKYFMCEWTQHCIFPEKSSHDGYKILKSRNFSFKSWKIGNMAYFD